MRVAPSILICGDARGTIMDLLPASPKFREAKPVTWPVSQFTMNLVGFGHVFTDAQPVALAPGLTLKVVPPATLILLKIVAFMDDPHRRVKNLDDIWGLLADYESDSERLFSDVVIDAALEDFGLAPAFLLGVDLRALCTDEEKEVVDAFLADMDEENPGWMPFVRARGVGDHVEEDAKAQLQSFRRGFERKD